MDSLFTININPDENVSLNKGKDNIKKYSKEENDEEKNDEDDKLINFNINEISKENPFEMLGDLNENQIEQYMNVRKNIRKYILKSFKKDKIINGRLENSEIEFLCDKNKKNNDQIKLILKKDIINNVINNFTKDKQKRNKGNDMNNRYFYLNPDEKGYNNNDDDDNDNYNEEERDEKNFMDLFMDTDMFEKKMNEEIERNNETDMNDDKKLSDNNEDDKNDDDNNEDDNNEDDNNEDDKNGDDKNDDDKNDDDKNDDDKNDDDIYNDDKKNEFHNDEVAIVISKNSDEDKTSITSDNILIEEKCIVPKNFNKILSNFEKRIKRWKINFPDINSENLFFHLYFLSELYKEKKYICQNCGSIECEKDSFMKAKCLNNFCFLCHKHISENMCHNTRSQYVSFKSHINSFNDYRFIMYPYNYISCLNCFKRKHIKCGSPPYIFAKNTYFYRKDYNFKSNRAYVLYMNNPLYIWDISNDKKNSIADSTNNDSDISVINIKGHKYNTLYNHDKISNIYSIDDYDSDYYDHDELFKNEKNHTYQNDTFHNDIQNNKKKRKFSSYNLGNNNSDKMLNKKSRDDYNHDDIRKNFHYDNKHTHHRKDEDRNYIRKNKYSNSYNNKYDNNINNKYNKHDENKNYRNDYSYGDDGNYVRTSVYEKKKNSFYTNNNNARNNNNDHYNLYNNNNNNNNNNKYNNKYNSQEKQTSGLYKYKNSSNNISNNYVSHNSFNNVNTTSNKNNNKHNSSQKYDKKPSWNPRENGQNKNNNNKKKSENNHRKTSGLYKNVY
ncbi:conserved Plasmodium protein, unknown function [Plasmodium sp. gorilla clade G2]|uniref:conserved Plasmodium protein, unknown function n=1 Tax=Plasmodium sp. gorilla clade G2 TaxID=880535 RepID=UPI000D21588F|nr:conserved Plasmodium protein, unknown function [Plasmodium sp. gorilla clade G2]SOV19539.1 conserved Plasmodium protein, unknown function [Plasmodium sp. gorilla clade G2]